MRRIYSSTWSTITSSLSWFILGSRILSTRSARHHPPSYAQPSIVGPNPACACPITECNRTGANRAPFTFTILRNYCVGRGIVDLYHSATTYVKTKFCCYSGTMDVDDQQQQQPRHVIKEARRLKTIDDFYPQAMGRSYLVVGASNSGKTSLVFQLLDSWRRDDPSINDRVLIFYSIYQPGFYRGLDARQGLDSLVSMSEEELRGRIVIIDDLQSQLRQHAELIERCYCVLSHHLPMTIVITIQNLIQMRLSNIVKNASYIAILRSRQSVQTLRHLQSALFPYNQKSLVEAQELCPYR